MGEQFFDTRLAIGGRHMVDTPVEIQIVFGSHALVESRKLEQRSDAGTNFIGLRACIVAEHTGPTICWLQQAEQEMDGSCFASPIWSQKAKNYSCRHLQCEIIDCFDRAKKT